MEEKNASQSSMLSFNRFLSPSHSNSRVVSFPKKTEESLDHKTICISVFLSYATFSFDEKDFVISHTNLFHLIRDTGIIKSKPKVTSPSSKSLNQYEIELLIRKVRSKGTTLNSQEYLNLLVLLSERTSHSIFKSKPKEAISKFIETYLYPYYIRLIEPNSSLKESSVFSFHRSLKDKIKATTFDRYLIEIFNSIHQVLVVIYKAYFVFENNNFNRIEEIIRRSLDDLIVFAKEFDVCPYLIEMNKMVILYHLILEMPSYEITKHSRQNGEVFDASHNMGKVLTLSRFCMLMLHLAKISFDKVKLALSPEQLDNCSDAEVLVLFLDKLQKGKGMECLNKRESKPITKGFSLIPSRRVIEKLDTVLISTTRVDENNLTARGLIISEAENKESEAEKTDNKAENKENRVNNYNSLSQSSMNCSERIEQALNHRQFSKASTSKSAEVSNNNLEKLNNVFEEYCSKGDKSTIHMLSITGYLSFLRQFNIITAEGSKKSTDSLRPKRLSQDLSLNNINKTLKKTPSATSLKSKFTEIEATLIFNTVCSQYTTKDKICLMNFAMFLASFEKLAERKYPLINSREAAMKRFFEVNIEPKLAQLKSSGNDAGTRKEELQKVLLVIKASKIDAIIKELKGSLHGIYANYCDPNELLNFNQFTQLFKDFGVFPDIVNVIQMKSIFYSLTELFRQSLEQDIKKEMKINNIQPTPMNLQQFNLVLDVDRINFEIYLDALGIAALYTKSNKPNASEVDKLFILLQKMALNPALENILRNSLKGINSTKEFNLQIDALKKKYVVDVNNEKGYYSEDSDNYKHLLNSPTSFEDILNS